MITQIEIDGFKTFKDFKVELAPFQVILGANGSGKSNLFDALQLLGRLAEWHLRDAFQKLRGEPDEVFTNTSGNRPATKMRLAAEMFINPTIEDDLGRKIELLTRRLRYEITVERGLNEANADQLRVVHESLTSIAPIHDGWMQKHFPAFLNEMDMKADQHSPVDKDFELIATRSQAIHLMPDGRGAHFSLPIGSRNVALQGVKSTEYPHIFAVREELRSLCFFQLNPAVLRQPSSTRAPQTLEPDGKNIAATLFRMQKEDKFALADVSRDMANLVPGITKIRVERDRIGDRYVVYAETTDKRIFSSHVLSDGTLRLLALATLKNDPQFHGIICLEEPENGVSPLHLERMAYLLRQMATDLSDPEQANAVPFCQVLVTTHSPLFVSQPDVIDSLLLAVVPTRIQGTDNPARVTIMVPAMTSEVLSHLENVSREDKALGAYAANILKSYLDSHSLEEARKELEQGHSELNKR